MSRFVPPKMLPVPSSHLRCAHRVRTAPVRGSVSGKGKHLGSERHWWTHEAGRMAEAAQVSRGPVSMNTIRREANTNCTWICVPAPAEMGSVVRAGRGSTWCWMDIK